MTTYSVMDALMASPINPLAPQKQRHQLTRMFDALHNLETSEWPSEADWSCVNDAVVIMEALRDMGEVQDQDKLLDDAIEVLGKAGFQSLSGKRIQLNTPDIQILRAVLEDYSTVLQSLSARTMISAHRMAEKRVLKIVKYQ